jgi:hypothetical protein
VACKQRLLHLPICPGKFAIVPRLVLLVAASLVLHVSAAQAARRSDGSTPAPASIAQLVTHVPTRTLNQVGAGRIAGPGMFGVFGLQGDLRSHGKPEILTMNLAWCPHCAANSWALAIALSRFGTLTGLRVLDAGTHFCTVASDPCSLSSKPPPCYPHTHGLSFLDTRYHSAYLSFRAVVLQDVQGHNLEKPTPRERVAIQHFDAQGSTPVLDVGGGFGFVSAGYDPAALARKTWSQIAGSLANPHDRIARHIDGLANLFTAAMCKATGGRPASVCTSRGVRSAAARLAHAAPPPPPPPGAPGP